MIDYARPEDVRYEERIRRDARAPVAERSCSGDACELRVALDGRLDIAALRGLRRSLTDAGQVDHLHLDFSAVRLLDAAALRLLADDLEGVEARGTVVTLRRLPAGIAERLLHHPLLRFARTDGVDDLSTYDALFTDPDRDHPGFVPSQR